MINWKNSSCLCVLLIFYQGVAGGPQERRLINDLMANYNKLERPVANESDAIVLKFGLTLQQIMDVDEKNQLLTTNLWLNLEWTDSNMRWDEAEYGGVKDIRVPPSSLWKPDILMYNSASEAFDGTFPTNVVVTSDGTCTYIPPGIFKSSCQIDITWFPFDDQHCSIKFGSWTYNGFNLDFQAAGEEGDTGTYISNGEWELIGLPAKRNEVVYECCPEPYLDITFTINIRRRTLYYFSNLIVPCLLISSMAILGFTLPPDSGEKLGLEVTIMLAITIFATIVGDMLPVTDSTPLIGTYFNCIMFMVAGSCIATVMVLNYHHRLADTHEMPDWVSSIFLQWLPWILRMQRPGQKITRKTIMMHKKMKDLDRKDISSKSLLVNVMDMDDDFRGLSGSQNSHPSHVLQAKSSASLPRSNSGREEQQRRPESVAGDLTFGIGRELSLILKEIKVITDKIRDDEESGAAEADWKFAAMVIDRLCLIVFSIFTAAATVGVLLAAPHVIVY